MEEKRKDLKNTKQKRIITDILQTLSSEQPSFYYMPTIEVAAEVQEFINQPGRLSQEELDAVKTLSRHDIQMLLSLH